MGKLVPHIVGHRWLGLRFVAGGFGWQSRHMCNGRAQAKAFGFQPLGRCWRHTLCSCRLTGSCWGNSTESLPIAALFSSMRCVVPCRPVWRAKRLRFSWEFATTRDTRDRRDIDTMCPFRALDPRQPSRVWQDCSGPGLASGKLGACVFPESLQLRETGGPGRH